MVEARRLGIFALVSWTVLAALWLAGVNGVPIPAWGARIVALAAVAAAIGWLGGLLRRILARPEGRLFAAVLVLGVVLGFAGLGHEVGKGYYTDEGHYLHHAREVNSGDLFTRSFVYPHLLYYLDAFALWLEELFATPVAWLAEALYGVEKADVVDWLVLRMVGAALGVLTVVPVFWLAFRVAGAPAAALASGLLLFSIHYQEGFQVNICDVPSAAFATFCMFFVGRLADGETRRDYVWAGVASGLAAAAKYPAGVVAVAIVGVWIVHRARSRRWGWGLLVAGAASLATFLLWNPSLFVHPDAVTGPRGVFFGLRQYGTGGWVGVTPDSNTAYYLGQLLVNFRWPAVVVAVAGIFGLEPAVRRRLLVLAPFPLVYLLLVSSMSMVVLRNLFPVIPTLAVFLGVMASGLVRRAAAAVPSRRRLVAGAVALLALAWPAAAALRQTVALVRPSTRDLMAAWVTANLPEGSGILKDSYTPNFSPHERPTVERRFAYRIPENLYADPRFDYVMVASSAYWRWFRPENEEKPFGDWYRRVFETHELVYRVEPGRWRLGPELRLYRLPGKAAEAVDRRVFRADEAFRTHGSMQGKGEVRFTPNGRRAIFAGTFAPGRYRLEVKGDMKSEGEVQVRGSGSEPVSVALAGGVGEIELSGAGKTFFSVELAPGSRLHRLVVSPAGGDSG